MTANIRIACVDDAEAVLAVYAPYCSTPVTFELKPPTEDEMRGRIAQTLKHYPWFVAVQEGVVVGYCYAHKFRERPAYRWSVETSVYVQPEQQGKGIGRALYERLFSTLEKQGFFIAVAGIVLPNAPSVKLHETFGFKQVGVFEKVGYKSGTWHNVGSYQRQLNECAIEPKEPMPIHMVL